MLLLCWLIYKWLLFNDYTYCCIVFSHSFQFNISDYPWLKFTLKELRRSVQSFFLFWYLQVIINGRLWTAVGLYCVETQPSCSNSMGQIVLPFYHLEMSFTLVLSWFCLGWPAVVLYGTQPAMPSDKRRSNRLRTQLSNQALEALCAMPVIVLLSLDPSLGATNPSMAETKKRTRTKAEIEVLCAIEKNKKQRTLEQHNFFKQPP